MDELNDRLDALEENFTMTMAAVDSRIAELSAQADGAPTELLIEVARLLRHMKSILEFVLALQEDIDSHRKTTIECLNNLCGRIEAIENLLRRKRVA